MAEPRIRLENVCKSFGTRKVLENVSFTAESGEFVSIVGPSGCGKSTLFNAIAGLLDLDGGRIFVDGTDATGTTEHCAYMPQDDLLFPWRTVVQNAALGLEVQGIPRREARSRARGMFARFGLEGFEDARPGELSGGMRQRAALLRTVLQERQVLLLDEPFGALDALTRTSMQDWLQGVWEQHRWTVLMVTHDIREATYLSDRILVLGPRPTTVARQVSIDLPRPRTSGTFSDSRFLQIEADLLGRLR